MRKQPKTIDEIVSSKITRSSFYRKLPLLKNQGIIKKIGNRYALSDYVDEPSYWESIKSSFEEVGANLIDISVRKATNNGVGNITGWFKWKHDKTCTIKGIIVLRSAPEVVKKAKEVGIDFRDDDGNQYAGVVLTKDPLGWMDWILWKNKLYQVSNFRDCDDGYDFSHRVGYLTWLPK